MKLPNEPGIYRIVNKTNDDCYVGRAKSLRDRWAGHKRDLAKGTDSCRILQFAWDKYGPENFDVEVLGTYPPEELSFYEYLWQLHYCTDSAPTPRYNILLEDPENRYVFSDDTIEKMRAGQIGRKHSEETKQKISESNVGQKRSEATRQNMRKPHNAGPLADEHKAKISAANKGKSYMSDAGRERMREFAKNRVGTRTGHKASVETRDRMRAARRQRPVGGLNLETLEMVEFSGLRMAGHAGFTRSSITACLNDETRTYRGFFWYDLDETYVLKAEK